MFRKLIRETLRRRDVGCAQRARWLGLQMRREPSDQAAAQEQLRRVREAARLIQAEILNRR